MRVPMVLDEASRSTCPRCAARLRAGDWDLVLEDVEMLPQDYIGIRGRLCGSCGVLFVSDAVALLLGPAMEICAGVIENDRRRLMAWRAWRGARWP